MLTTPQLISIHRLPFTQRVTIEGNQEEQDMLRIKSEIIEAIVEHSKGALPHESCGYLAEKNGTIVRHYELTNLDQSDEHFSMDPKEQFAAIKDMRSRGLKQAAVYHSHPETPARPSEEDIRLAFDPEISYVIVSLADNACTVKSFKIRAGEVNLEEIEEVE